MHSKKTLGNLGEDYTVDFLKQKGVTILQRNWRFKRLEVDIIAENSTFLIFLEVKTRTSTYYGEPSTFLSESQQRRIIEAANHYVEEHNIQKEIRFDVASILYSNEQPAMDYIEDAFSPQEY